MEPPETPHYEVPTRAQRVAFLLRLCFGNDPDSLSACVAGAYSDLKRTLRGFDKHADKTALRANAHALVRSSIISLPGSVVDQFGFDEWHRTLCDALCEMYVDKMFPFMVGQAQKWINMALKYIYLFGEDRISGYSSLYHFGHVPLDGIILDRFSAFGAPQLSSAWSRLQSYDEYFAFQKWIRETFPKSAPLSVEFWLWQKEPTRNSARLKTLHPRLEEAKASDWESVVRDLLLNRHRFEDVPKVAGTGVYAFFLTNRTALPAVSIGTESPIYIGMSESCIEARNHFLHRNSSSSTFRRSLGAILKGQLQLRAVARGPKRSDKDIIHYKFQDPGEAQLSTWMKTNLEYSYVLVERNVVSVEKSVIQNLQPPLNIDGCDHAYKATLLRLRKVCRDEARGD